MTSQENLSHPQSVAFDYLGRQTNLSHANYYNTKYHRLQTAITVIKFLNVLEFPSPECRFFELVPLY